MSGGQSQMEAVQQELLVEVKARLKPVKTKAKPVRKNSKLSPWLNRMTQGD